MARQRRPIPRRRCADPKINIFEECLIRPRLNSTFPSYAARDHDDGAAAAAAGDHDGAARADAARGAASDHDGAASDHDGAASDHDGARADAARRRQRRVRPR